MAALFSLLPVTLVIVVLFPHHAHASAPTVVAPAPSLLTPTSPYPGPEDILPYLWMCRLCGVQIPLAAPSLGPVPGACRCPSPLYMRVSHSIGDAVSCIDPRLLDASSPGSASTSELRPWEAQGYPTSPSPAEMLRTKSQQSQASDVGADSQPHRRRPLDALACETLENEYETRQGQHNPVEGMFSSPSSPFYAPGYTPYKPTSPFFPGPSDLTLDTQVSPSPGHGLGISVPVSQPLPVRQPPADLQAPDGEPQEPTPADTPQTPAVVPRTPPAKNSTSSRWTDPPGLVSDSDVDAEGEEDTDMEMATSSPEVPERPPHSPLPFPCPQCDKTFGRNCDLSRHSKLHTPVTDRRNACPDPHCDRTFHDAKDVTRHYDNVHRGVRNFPCPAPDCDYHRKGMGRKDNMERHVRKKHPELAEQMGWPVNPTTARGGPARGRGGGGRGRGAPLGGRGTSQ